MNRNLLLGSLLSVLALALLFTFSGLFAGQAGVQSSAADCSCVVCCEDGSCCCETGVCKCVTCSCSCACCSDSEQSGDSEAVTCSGAECLQCKTAEVK